MTRLDGYWTGPTPKGTSLVKRPLRVLFVEDQPEVRLTTAEALRIIGGGLITVDMATRLSEGLEKLNKGGVSAVLVDLNLPDAKDVEAIDRLQQEHPEVPIVVFSGEKDPDKITECLHLGAMDYVVKDQGPAILLDRIRHAVVLHETRKAYQRVDEMMVKVQAGNTTATELLQQLSEKTCKKS